MNVTADMSSREQLGEMFIPRISPTQTMSIDDDTEMEIKHEAVDYHNITFTPAPDSESDFAQCLVSTIPEVDHSSVKVENKDINDTYLDLHQCQRDCETCQRYLKMLCEHVRSTHWPPQPTQDPLHIDPLIVDTDNPLADQSPSTEIKCEGVENIENIDSSQEDSRLNSESDPDFESQSESESDTDTDYNASTHMTRSVHRRNVTKNGSRVSKSSKSKKSFLPSRQQYKCDECDKTYSTKGNLKEHMRIHTGEKPFKCDQCEKCFTRSDTLSIHKKSHTGEKRYVCPVCKNHFIRLSHLNTHMRVHTGERPYKCEQCNKSFSQKNTLTVHKRSHTGEKV